MATRQYYLNYIIVRGVALLIKHFLVETAVSMKTAYLLNIDSVNANGRFACQTF